MKRIEKWLGALKARMTRTYYYEDYQRVYPDGIKLSSKGKKREATPDAVKSFLNHRKFYLFASQFAKNKQVVDVGCGSGYGCQLLAEKGALSVHGYDASKASIEFAKMRYTTWAQFEVKPITGMKGVADESFDLTLCSEVLEHIKEYGKHRKAVVELKRITRKKGLIIVGTPNLEMLPGHGFSFDEIRSLFSAYFSRFVIFENALLPFYSRDLWQARLREGKTGIVVTQNIVLEETVLPQGVTAEIKKGIDAGTAKFLDYEVNTGLLHNTHSWVIMAAND
jgi:2-polyprenyl-3-methyl-5-hydroxy-6-metoxy-1,4-benzoquinol methylase